MKALRYSTLILLVLGLLAVVAPAQAQPLQITSLLPAVGPALGGTPVLITGAGFESGATVNFDSIALDPTNVNVLTPNVIAIVTPPASGLGTVEVTVTNPDGGIATMTNGFGYACLAGQSFNPVALTSNSFDFGIVVPASYPVLPANAAVTVTMDGGPLLNGNTWYEVGTDLGAPSTGLPPAGSLLVDESRPDHQFILPSSWIGNNCLFVGNYPGFGLTEGAFVLTDPIACTSLSFLNSAGNGPANLLCIINHADGTTETNDFVSLDWFNSASAAFSAQGRLTVSGNGGFNHVGSPAGCKLFSTDVALANTNSPVTAITFAWISGGRAAIFAVSASTGSAYTPVAVTGYDADIVVETTLLPLPYTASMDNGANISNGGGNTWYETGWDPLAPTTGFPPQGSLVPAFFTGTPFQMSSNYSAPMATLIDASHPTASLTPLNPQPCAAFSFLTSGGSLGGNQIMTSLLVMQHADGTSETNVFTEFDWFDDSVFPAYTASGRVNFSNGRVLNNVNSSNPNLFETQFALGNVASPVTNIMLQYLQGPSFNSTTFFVAVSAIPSEAPTINCPGNISVGCSPDLLVPVQFAATATDNCDTNPTVTYSIAPGSGFPIGITTVTATARNSSGVESSCSFDVTRAALAFEGFLAPLGGADATGGTLGKPLGSFERDSSIPVKFSAACGGSPILSGIQRLDVIKYTSAGPGPVLPAVSKDAATTSNHFRRTGAVWRFNLDPRATGMTQGIWLLRASLSDGSKHAAWIEIR
jgi:hypothetical protein